MSDFQYHGLPKWPQMRVAGRQVTPDQASEIIRRTDTFFAGGYGGNDRVWEERVKSLVGMPNMDTDDWNASWAAQQAWEENWGCLSTEYVKNSWVSCAFIGGPHGWCSPLGTIYFRDNIGKWPSGEEVEADWQKLAEAFPFLDLEALLMSGESCEDDAVPVVGLVVKDGLVTPHLPEQHAFHQGDYAWANVGPSLEQQAMQIGLMPARVREVGVSEDMIRQWAASAQQKIPA